MESERLKFHLTEAEYVEGQKVLRFVFTKSVCFRNLIALAAFGAAAGAYAYLHDGGSIAACVFWSASVYMLWVRLILLISLDFRNGSLASSERMRKPWNMLRRLILHILEATAFRFSRL